jgi:glutaminyl-tRNA synthetase
MSKRKLLRSSNRRLSRLGRSADADDRRHARRGYTPEAIRDFCDASASRRRRTSIDVALLEHTVREDLNRARRARWPCCAR